MSKISLETYQKRDVQNETGIVLRHVMTYPPQDFFLMEL